MCVPYRQYCIAGIGKRYRRYGTRIGGIDQLPIPIVARALHPFVKSVVGRFGVRLLLSRITGKLEHKLEQPSTRQSSTQLWQPTTPSRSSDRLDLGVGTEVGTDTRFLLTSRQHRREVFLVGTDVGTFCLSLVFAIRASG